jgi:hypothetical protein
VTSYDTLRAEYSARERYIASLESNERRMSAFRSSQLTGGRRRSPPDLQNVARPDLKLLSKATTGGGWAIVLDEACHANNKNNATYDAVRRARRLRKECIWVTATPMQNNWTDMYTAISMLNFYKFSDMEHIKKTFDPVKDTPDTEEIQRMGFFLSAITLRRQ